MNTGTNGANHTEDRWHTGATIRRGWRAIALGCAAGLAVALGGSAATGASASMPATDTPYCGITWGSQVKQSEGFPRVGSAEWITNIRSGQHPCFDRLVIDLRGGPPGYRVQYVTGFVNQDTQEAIPLRGGAGLRIIALATDFVSVDEEPGYRLTYEPDDRSEAVDVTGYRTFRQVAYFGSFERQTEIGLGVRAQLPFRVFTLDDGSTSRLVVDVAHQWTASATSSTTSKSTSTTSTPSSSSSTTPVTPHTTSTLPPTGPVVDTDLPAQGSSTPWMLGGGLLTVLGLALLTGIWLRRRGAQH
jgi:hypothetical protein